MHTLSTQSQQYYKMFVPKARFSHKYSVHVLADIGHLQTISLSLSLYIYICIYICVCVCVCVTNKNFCDFGVFFVKYCPD